MAVHPLAGSAAKAAGAAQAAADAIGHRALAKFELLSAPSRREPRFVFAASWKLRILTASSSSGEVTACLFTQRFNTDSQTEVLSSDTDEI